MIESRIEKIGRSKGKQVTNSPLLRHNQSISIHTRWCSILVSGVAATGVCNNNL